MADVSDVEAALVSTIAQVLYPNGTGQPSLTGPACRIYRGWPAPAQLDADLAAGTINVSVYPNAAEVLTSRYPKEWQPASIPASTLTLVAADTTVTVAGTPSSPLNAAVIVNGIGYVYSVQPGDTPTQIATGLAALISPHITATSSGPVITIPEATSLVARAGVFGTAIREIKRQRRNYQITFWCPTPASRDAIVPPVDIVLANMNFIALPDGSSGRLLYVGSPPSDRVQREGLYRRDLIYSVEYPTTETMTAPTIVVQTNTLLDFIGDAPATEPPDADGEDALLLTTGVPLLLTTGYPLLLQAP